MYLAIIFLPINWWKVGQVGQENGLISLELLDRVNSSIKNFRKKIKNTKLLNAKSINDKDLAHLEKIDCMIIDNYQNNIDEKLFYSILNQSKQLDKFIVINSTIPLKEFNLSLKDLQSRLNSFVSIGIELPTDDLLNVIISKSFSDKQIDLSPRISEYIIKNTERSYEKMFKIFKKDIDELSLSSGKAININLIKKVLNNK